MFAVSFQAAVLYHASFEWKTLYDWDLKILNT